MLTTADNTPRPVIDATTRILGMHAIVPLAYDGIDLVPLWNELAGRVGANGADAAAMVDLATILQSHGRTNDALPILKGAIEMQRDYCVVHGDGSGLRLLAFVTAGDFMANTPLDFLLNGSNAVLWLRYVDGDTTDLDNLPDYDIAFMAIGESNDNGPVLDRMRDLLAAFPGPILNNDPALINNLTRDGVSAMLANEPSLLSPSTARVTRDALTAVARGTAVLSDLTPGLDFPIIVRPIGTHAGNGMERFTTRFELAAWLDTQPDPYLYIAPYIDYAGPDGLFNKQRIVFIQGKAYPSHMALSNHWIVHYLSSGMPDSPEKRAVEQAWMENFDTDFAVRHKSAFDALYRHIGLDYFGIDSAELPDGRLLVFEVDVAMLVHDMDSAEIYPYKKVAMQKLFDDFVAGIVATSHADTQRSAA